jgi:ATP adenylyltransferase
MEALLRRWVRLALSARGRAALRAAAVGGGVLAAAYALWRASASLALPAATDAGVAAARRGTGLRAALAAAEHVAARAGALREAPPARAAARAEIEDDGVPFQLLIVGAGGAGGAAAAAPAPALAALERLGRALSLRLLVARLAEAQGARARAGAALALALSPLLAVPAAVRWWLAGAGAAPGDALARLPAEAYVAHVSRSHAVVLATRPALAHHCVIVAGAGGGGAPMPRQDAAADADDLEALWVCVRQLDALGFYNCGAAAGASQPRRHTQLVPFASLRAAHPALAARGLEVPLEAALREELADGAYHSQPGAPFRLRAYSRMAHAAAMLGGDVRALPAAAAAAQLYAWYKGLLAAAAASAAPSGAAPAAAGGGGAAAPPHNLILTPSFMFVVLRSGRHSDHLAPPNALAYAGLLVVAATSSREALREIGPLTVLEACAVRAAP